MATPVLIIGRSGTGKSTSLRNCVGNDNWNLIRVLDKPLPFKGKINGYLQLSRDRLLHPGRQHNPDPRCTEKCMEKRQRPEIFNR